MVLCEFLRERKEREKDIEKGFSLSFIHHTLDTTWSTTPNSSIYPLSLLGRKPIPEKNLDHDGF
jgi:hypothetical protein